MEAAVRDRIRDKNHEDADGGRSGHTIQLEGAEGHKEEIVDVIFGKYFKVNVPVSQRVWILFLMRCHRVSM